MTDRTPASSSAGLTDGLLNALCRPEDTLILLHRHPDGDAVGSALALRAILRAMGSRAFCLCADPLPGRLAFLAPDEPTALDEAALPSDLAPARVVAVDVASPAQLGALEAAYAPRVTLTLDHHEKGQPLAPGWVDPTAAATGEMICLLADALLQRKDLAVLPVEVPALLHAALSSDTGCFRYSNTTPRTLRVAAALLERGLSSEEAAEINRRLFDEKPRSLLCAEALAFEHMTVLAGGRLAISALDAETIAAHGLSEDDLGTLVDIPRRLEGVEVAVAIRPDSNAAQTAFRVSLRAAGGVDVAAIAAQFGGGGHKKAAGCGVTCADVAAAVDLISAAVIPAL